MKVKSDNIFNLEKYVNDSEKEMFEILLSGNNFKVERIVSTGHITPEGKWYDQQLDEWVLLIQGQARLEFDNNEIIELIPGDYLMIPAHTRHRVAFTSTEPKCIWLAIHTIFSK
ncbi:MAG: cupin domain-containing protein [Bacteroidales bacterium]|nr:cupin domain-containing protein [Bacteroidales bacterium]